MDNMSYVANSNSNIKYLGREKLIQENGKE